LAPKLSKLGLQQKEVLRLADTRKPLQNGENNRHPKEKIELALGIRQAQTIWIDSIQSNRRFLKL